MSNSYDSELRVALRAVHLASLLTKSHLLSHLQSQSQSIDSSASDGTTKAVPEETKSDSSEVTVADFASQAILIHAIHSVYPNDVFIAEEGVEMLQADSKLCDRVWNLVESAGRVSALFALDGGVEDDAGSQDLNPESSNVDPVPRLPSSREQMLTAIDLGSKGGLSNKPITSRRTWVLDPIDGTRTYIKAQQYAVCLCLVDQGLQQVAVLGCPNLATSLDEQSRRVRVEEGLVDLRLEGGLLVSALRTKGTCVSTITHPLKLMPLDRWLSMQNAALVEPVMSTDVSNRIETASPLQLQFTDSQASPHISPALHERVFSFFGGPKALDLWSMQMKYIALTLRAAHADAMIRIPPQPDYHASVWDHGGGQLLLTESGGTLTDAMGEQFILDGQTRRLVHNWGVCSVRGAQFEAGLLSKQVHARVLERVTKELEERSKDAYND